MRVFFLPFDLLILTFFQSNLFWKNACTLHEHLFWLGFFYRKSLIWQKTYWPHSLLIVLLVLMVQRKSPWSMAGKWVKDVWLCGIMMDSEYHKTLHMHYSNIITLVCCKSSLIIFLLTQIHHTYSDLTLFHEIVFSRIQILLHYVSVL